MPRWPRTGDRPRIRTGTLFGSMAMHSAKAAQILSRRFLASLTLPLDAWRGKAHPLYPAFSARRHGPLTIPTLPTLRTHPFGNPARPSQGVESDACASNRSPPRKGGLGGATVTRPRCPPFQRGCPLVEALAYPTRARMGDSTRSRSADTPHVQPSSDVCRKVHQDDLHRCEGQRNARLQTPRRRCILAVRLATWLGS